MSLLDPKWKYTHSTATDIRKTFAKARKDLAKKERSSIRPPKLQLMRGPAASTAPVNYGSQLSSAIRHGMRSIGDDDVLDRRSAEPAALVSARHDPRIASRS
jgi:hypothetical protein